MVTGWQVRVTTLAASPMMVTGIRGQYPKPADGFAGDAVKFAKRCPEGVINGRFVQ